MQFNTNLNGQGKSPYFGKKFSILGDSISTLDGYNPIGYHLFYTGEICEKTGVHEMKDTWWRKVIDYFGGELLANNSWSGSRVSMMPGGTPEKLFPSGCSDERTAGLHLGQDQPEVIMIYLGTNDWANGVLVDDCSAEFPLPEATVELFKSFEGAYVEMLRKVKRNYPSAEVWCCTLCETIIPGKPAFKFPHAYAGIHIERYNGVIRNAAKNFGCKLIDLFSFHTPYASLDGTHPTAEGMATIASMILKEIEKVEVDTTVECENNHHEYIIAEMHTGFTRYVCKRCGKEKWEDSFALNDAEASGECAANACIDSEYVILDPEKTRFLFLIHLSYICVNLEKQ